MSKPAWAYVSTVLGTGLLFGALTLLHVAPTSAMWGTFAALAILATLAQLFKAAAPNHVLFYTSPIFFFASALLLPPFLVVLLVALPHIIEWGKERWQRSAHLRAWYLQPFNAAMHGIAALSSAALDAQFSRTAGTAGVAPLLIGLAAALCYVCLNRLLLGLALVLARGVSWHDPAVLDPATLLTDLVLACLGLVVATLWRVQPAFIVPALAPLALMYQALMIPQLKQQATVDAKTGLANAGHFKTLFDAELDRATRFNRPLAVLMADLDLLRNINNAYGHLAGDAVLAGIGQRMRQTVGEYGICGRFGGEEFAVVLPEAEPQQAEELAERLRLTIAAARFQVESCAQPIGVTMSLGVACFPRDGTSAAELVYAADMAVYEAKTRGRNQVVRAADLPWDRRVPQPAGAAPAASAEIVPAAPAEIATPPTLPGMPGRGPSDVVDDGLAQPGDYGHAAPVAPGLARLCPQPAVASATVFLAGVAVLAGLRAPGVTLGPQPLAVSLEAMALAGALVVAYQYRIYIRLHLWVQLSTMVYYLIAARLSLPLAVGAAGLGTLLGELSVRQQRRLQASDIATATGRWVLLVLLGTLVAHVPAPRDWSLALLAACAVVLALGDLLTLPLLLAPITGERPLRLLRTVTVETAWPDGVQYFVGFVGLLAGQRAGWALALLVVPAVLVYRAAQHLHEVQASTHQVLESMADTVDLRDPSTGGHSRRVAEHCAAILREMQLGGPERDLILSAARVHDIGKIAIPDAILHKPGPLTAEEWALMQTHPVRGAEVLARYQDFSRGRTIVLHHHEAWDGSGYPQGLKGLEIPFGARVMAVADSFDAMTSDRPYRRGMSVGEAASILRQGRGQQWDPQVVDAFQRSIADHLKRPQRPILQYLPGGTEPQQASRSESGA